MAKEDNISSLLSKKDQAKFLSHRVQMPRVHKLHWKEEKISRDWLERISSLNSSIVSTNNVASAHDVEVRLLKIQNKTESQNSLHDLTSPRVVQPVEIKPKPDKSFPNLELVSQILEEQYQSRKPDPNYITLVSQISVPIRFVEISERRCSDFIVTELMPEKKCVQVEELQLPPVFFTVTSSHVSLETKRKLSFEYIQEVSKLGVCK